MPAPDRPTWVPFTRAPRPLGATSVLDRADASPPTPPARQSRARERARLLAAGFSPSSRGGPPVGRSARGRRPTTHSVSAPISLQPQSIHLVDDSDGTAREMSRWKLPQSKRSTFLFGEDQSGPLRQKRYRYTAKKRHGTSSLDYYRARYRVCEGAKEPAAGPLAVQRPA